MASRREGRCCATVIEPDACLCPLEGTMEVLSKRWALSVVATVSARGRIRYNDLLKLLEGVGPSTLAKRLDELEQARLLVRTVYPEAPPRVEYSLSPEGKQLAGALRPLLRWAASASS